MYRGVLSQVAKRLEREADQSSPSAVEVKNMWSFNSNPPYVFMACSGPTQSSLFIFSAVGGGGGDGGVRKKCSFISGGEPEGVC
jgi:hypothetical protein